MLALGFPQVSYGHSFAFAQWSARRGMGSMATVGRGRMGAIAVLEFLGAIGLILPAATGILPWLTTIAAACLALLMGFAAVFHAGRPAEGRNIVLNVILGVIALLIVYGRLVVSPF